MKIIKDFNEFINEAIITRAVNWPDDWKNSQIWKDMEAIGFKDITSSVVAKNGNIQLNNDLIPIYPSGVHLQRSGYIRDCAATSGYIKKYANTRVADDNQPFTLFDMLEYLYATYNKIYINNIVRAKNSGLSKETSNILAKQRNTNWSVNKITGRIDVKGDMTFIYTLKNIVIPNDLRFGRVTGNFCCIGNDLIDTYMLPTFVGKNLDVRDNKIMHITHQIDVKSKIASRGNPIEEHMLADILTGKISLEEYLNKLSNGEIQIDLNAISLEKFASILGWISIW